MNDRATFTRMEESTQDDWRKIGGEFAGCARTLPERQHQRVPRRGTVQRYRRDRPVALHRHVPTIEQLLIDAGRSLGRRHFFFVRVAPPRPRSGTSASSNNRCTKP